MLTRQPIVDQCIAHKKTAASLGLAAVSI